MTHVFHFDSHPRVHLITEAPPGPTWNGFESPCPTPRELVRFLDKLRPEIPDEREWWQTLASLVGYYLDDQPAWDEPITGVNGFVWQASRMFNPTERRMNLLEAQGHWDRKGHRLVAYYTPIDEQGTIVEMVRICCPEEGSSNGEAN